jgi:ubiquinone/menaquinone biosynthesis C-methylase UbiE
MTDTSQKRFKILPEMEGTVARWYARQRGSASQLRGYTEQAARLTADLPDGADLLEVAPGPGYLSIEIARLGRWRVTGLDVSHSFVQIATDHARRAGVSVAFRHGDVAAMPFGDEAFDRIVCQAAFKNFTRPVVALNEMYRVLRPGGTAIVGDLSAAASRADIGREVAGMQLGAISTVVTKWTLLMLRRRAYRPEQFERLAAESRFGSCDIRPDGIGLDIRLTRTASP